MNKEQYLALPPKQRALIRTIVKNEVAKKIRQGDFKPASWLEAHVYNKEVQKLVKILGNARRQDPKALATLGILIRQARN